MNYLVDRVEAARLKNGPAVERLEPSPESALAYLQSLYRDPSVDPIVRRRCAIACLPFESPKLEALAIRHLEGDLGERLDRAIKRAEELNKARAEGRLIEGVATEIKEEPEGSPSVRRL